MNGEIMKRKNLNSQDYNYNHTRERCKERYGFDISMLDYVNLCYQIINDTNTKIINTEQQKNGTQLVCRLKFNNEYLYVVYNVKTQNITTMLPKESFE